MQCTALNYFGVCILIKLFFEQIVDMKENLNWKEMGQSHVSVFECHEYLGSGGLSRKYFFPIV